jgi:hypothetical protein
MVNLGANPWGLKSAKLLIRAGRIHNLAWCDTGSHCARYAKIQIECRGRIGLPF